MLLDIAIVALCLAVAVGIRGWVDRYDERGRRRGWPFISVGLLVVIAVVLGYPTIRRHQLEGRLTKVADVLVGQPVQVHCQTFGQTFTQLNGDLGFVKFGPDGVPEHKTTIERDTCGHLRGYLGGDQAHPSLDEITAVHVLTHESMHMRGQTNEADAECEAMQRDAETAQLLGATPQEGLALAREYWGEVYPDMPDGYRSGECTPGGALDEHLPDAPWSPGSVPAVKLPAAG